jgi:hypothetical protein
MSKHDLITKDFALYVVHYFASMETWSKKDILAEIDRKIKEADEDVVRCKDCRYMEFYRDAFGLNKYHSICEMIDRPVCYDDFCSNAERRENESDS